MDEPGTGAAPAPASAKPRGPLDVLLASLRVAALATAVRALVAVKEIVVAGLFGTGETLDAFIGASMIPVFAINVLVSTLGTALIPRLARLEQEGSGAAEAVSSKAAVWLTGILAALAAGIAFAAPLLVAILHPRFDPATAATAVEALRVLAATIPLSGLAAVWGGMLSLRNRFAVVALAPAFAPLLTMALVLQLRTGVLPLVYGALGGALLETTLLGMFLKAGGVRLLPRPTGASGGEPAFLLRQYVPVVIGTLFSSATVFVDQAMASALGPRHLSSLSFGSKITGMALSVLAAGLGMVLLPQFSQAVATRKWAELRSQYTAVCRRLVLGTVPVALAVVFFSAEIVRLVFQRGAFTPDDTAAVSRIQSMYALQIPFFLLGVVTARLISALSANRFLMWIGALNLAVSISSNLLLRARLGAPGIALSASLVQAISCLSLIGAASWLLRRTESGMLVVEERGLR